MNYHTETDWILNFDHGIVLGPYDERAKVRAFHFGDGRFVKINLTPKDNDRLIAMTDIGHLEPPQRAPSTNNGQAQRDDRRQLTEPFRASGG